MSETLPSIPAVEIRETFTPSERVKDVLMGLLGPELDAKTKESLRATFLFKSWRRRIMGREDFSADLGRFNGLVRTTTKQFESLGEKRINLATKINLTRSIPGSDLRRIVVSPVPNVTSMKAKTLLEKIPSVEHEPLFTEQQRAKRKQYMDLQNMFFIELTDSQLASDDYIAQQLSDEQKQIEASADLAFHYSLKPQTFAIREVQAPVAPAETTYRIRKPVPIGQDSVDRDEDDGEKLQKSA